MRPKEIENEIDYTNWKATVIHRCFNDREINDSQIAYISSTLPIRKEFDRGFNEVYSSINWEQKGTPSLIEFQYDDKIYYMLHSTPTIWSYIGEEPLIVDTVVVAESPEETAKYFELEVNNSDHLKESRISDASELVKEIEGIEGVKLILGRGSTYDDRRMTHDRDDVDIVIFIDWEETEHLEKILFALEEKCIVFGGSKNVQVQGLTFNENDQAPNTLFPNRSARYTVNLDLIPYKLIHSAESSDEVAISRLGWAYNRDMFRNSKFLGGESSIKGRLIALCDKTEKLLSNRKKKDGKA